MIAGTARRATLFAVLALVVVALAAMTTGARALASEEATPSDTSPPPVTQNEFFPESAELTDCVGVLERPGCGNENRGGWRQTLVFGLMGAGLVIVFTKVAIGVRRTRRRDSTEPQPPVAH